MTDRRRRRKPLSNQEILSEGESQQNDELLSLSESEHDSADEYLDMSEYESPDEENDEGGSKDQDGVVEGNDTLDAYCAKIQSQESCNQSDDEVVRTESFSEEDVARGSGDGKSDDDHDSKFNNKDSKVSEDKNSPFFIPTKGNFYQHDVRSENSRGSRGRGSRTLRNEFSKERWLHDKYDEDEQTPKTRDELIEEYGYDIRSQRHDRSSVASGSKRGRKVNGRFGMSRQQAAQSAQPRFNQKKERVSSRGFNQTAAIKSRNFHSRKSALKITGQLNSPTSEERAVVSKPVNALERNKTDFTEADSESKFKKKEKCSSTSKERFNNLPSGMDSVLNVISNREQEKLVKRKPREPRFSQRNLNKTDSCLSEELQSLSINKEFAPPKRYSSLRQRAADPFTPQTHHLSKQPPSNLPQKLSSQLPPEWIKQSIENQHNQQRISSASTIAADGITARDSTSKTSNVVHSPFSLHSDPQPAVLYNSSIETASTSELASSNLPAGIRSGSSNVSKINDATASKTSSLAQMQWYEAAIAYQQAVNLLNPNPIHPQHGASHDLTSHPVGEPSLILGNEHLPGSPPQLPPQSLGQGDIAGLGSMVFSPALSHDFMQRKAMETLIYRASNYPDLLLEIPRNVLADRNVIPPSLQLPFPPSNPMGQQVGGVTYYPNPLHPMQSMVPGNNPNGSPMQRMNAAIPIKHPME